MKARHGLLLAGSLWELVRFILVLSVLASVLQAAGAGRRVFPWLLAVGSGNLMIAAGGGVLALFPVRYAPLIVLLRLGKVLGVFCFILLVVSGALGLAAGNQIFGIGGRAITGGIILLDLLFLAILIGWRSGEPQAPVNGPGEGTPDSKEMEVQDSH
jgi:hypothetical protein